MHRHAAAVHFHQPANDREPDAEATPGAFVRGVRLSEQLEDARQHVRGNADARVLDANDGMAGFRLGRDEDAAARLGKLGRVVDQVGEHLA